MRNKCAHIQGKATASQWSAEYSRRIATRDQPAVLPGRIGLSYNNIKAKYQVPVSLLAKRPLACNLPFAERELVCFPGVVKRSDPPSATSTDKGQGHSQTDQWHCTVLSFKLLVQGHHVHAVTPSQISVVAKARKVPFLQALRLTVCFLSL